jgi:DNA-binding PadR family transcriptional regulator
MSSTRLLMLGAVRIFQPVHGYFVRRELLTWRADQRAKINPGSIYNALRALFLHGSMGRRGDARPGRGGPGAGDADALDRESG